MKQFLCTRKFSSVDADFKSFISVHVELTCKKLIHGRQLELLCLGDQMPEMGMLVNLQKYTQRDVPYLISSSKKF